jgi:hypothetical protein
MAKKKIRYLVFIDPTQNEQRMEITSQEQFTRLDLSSTLSKIIISNHEMDNIRKLNEAKIKKLQSILKK